ncbi:hypothetical protein, partial [Flavobacterium sp.]|uniref:hypothetical protein n=1 Tax=Flavobacterium sp. TaxID=239 RepID=UPI0026222B32
MNNIKKAFLLFLLSAAPLFAQQKITLEEIWRGTFRTRNMDELQALKKTNHYTVLNTDWQAH